MNYSNVSVVMISRNEEKAIAKVISDIKRNVPGSEILLVDSSTDNTPKVAEKLGAKVIRQFPPKGYGPAMEKALLTPKTDIVVTLDCDNTYPTDVIPLLISKIREGYDIVGTSRISKGKPKNMPYLNYFANLFVNLVASLAFFKIIKDIHSGMRAYRGSLLRSIKWKPKGSALPVELLLKPTDLGYKVIEIPVFYRQRVGETKLDRLNSLLWTFRRIFSSRFSNRVNLFGFVFLLMLVIFIVNNAIKYNPDWGYDRFSHIGYLVSLSDHLRIPTENNYASNPPLYYFVSAAIYFFSHSLKLVQFLSVLIYVSEIILLYKALKLINTRRGLTFSLLFFFSFLPISLNFGFMILNYTLGFFFSLTTLFILIYLIHKKEVNSKWVILVGLLSALGILTSLNNLATLLVSAVFLLFFPYSKLADKIKNLFLLLLLTLVIVGPYYVYKTQTYKCFFCTFNRPKTNQPFDKVYPLNFYYNFDLNSFEKPYSPNHIKDGLWITLHQTLYGDYFGYLTDSKLNRSVKNTTGLIYTGNPGTSSAHYVDQPRITKLRILNYLGIPISAMFIFVTILNLRDGLIFFIKKKKEFFINFLFTITIFITFFQFLAYIIQYPDYVNIHTGYLYPVIFILTLLIGKYFQNKWSASLAVFFLTIYSLISYYTFFIR